MQSLSRSLTHHNQINQRDSIKRDTPQVHHSHNVSNDHRHSECHNERNPKLETHQQECHGKDRSCKKNSCTHMYDEYQLEARKPRVTRYGIPVRMDHQLSRGC